MKHLVLRQFAAKQQYDAWTTIVERLVNKLALLSLLATVLLVGCSNSSQPTNTVPGRQQQDGYAVDRYCPPPAIKFNDNVEAKGESPEKLSDIVFTQVDGAEIQLKDFLKEGVDNVLLVVTRG